MARRLLVLAVLAAALLAAMPATLAEALPRCRSGYQCITFFYSGPDATDQVGYQSTDCFGQVVRSGQLTQWSRTVESPCPS